MKISGELSEKGLKRFIEEEFKIDNRKRLKIWIVVVDSTKTYFFRKPNHHLEKIGEAFPTDMAKDISNKDNGRTAMTSGENRRHRVEGHDASLSHETDVFVRDVADFLNGAVMRKALDRLILIAAPKTLGKLRSFLSKETHCHINAEIAKDLTHLNEKELYDYLNKALWI